MEVGRVEARSERVVQTYSWGCVVWHVWGETQTTHHDREVAGNVRMDHTSKSSTKPLVLLHGGSGSWTHWLRNVEHFAQYRTVWALDILGFGDSSLPGGVTDADGLVPYVADIFSHTFNGEAVDVLGFSFGGMTAGLVAARHPHLIKQLVLVGAPGLGLFEKELPMRGMRPDMNDAEQRRVHRHNLNAMMFAQSDTVSEEVVDLQQANVARDRMRRRRIARTDVLVQVQANWMCQVHGVWGELDALYLGTLQKVPHVLPKLASFTRVPNAGHWVMFERPDSFHAVVDPLLNC